MSAPIGYGSITKTEALRWGACFAAVLFLHGGIAMALLGIDVVAAIRESGIGVVCVGGLGVVHREERALI